MGYAYYELDDGREAGYAVEATCDFPECSAEIDRGLSYLCGAWPYGNVPKGEEKFFGCQDYFCSRHLHSQDHQCTRPLCGVYSDDGWYQCHLTQGHDGVHEDQQENFSFTETE